MCTYINVSTPTKMSTMICIYTYICMHTCTHGQLGNIHIYAHASNFVYYHTKGLQCGITKSGSLEEISTGWNNKIVTLEKTT